jgi:hypothetical protein
MPGSGASWEYGTIPSASATPLTPWMPYFTGFRWALFFSDLRVREIMAWRTLNDHPSPPPPRR